jgi:hypothetical protein
MAACICCDYRVVYYAPGAYEHAERLAERELSADEASAMREWNDVRPTHHGMCEARRDVCLVLRHKGVLATLHGVAASATDTTAATLLTAMLSRLDVPNDPPARIVRVSVGIDMAAITVPPAFWPVLHACRWPRQQSMIFTDVYTHKLRVPVMRLSAVPIALARVLADLARRHPSSERAAAVQAMLRNVAGARQLAAVVAVRHMPREVWHAIHTDFLSTI